MALWAPVQPPDKPPVLNCGGGTLNPSCCSFVLVNRCSFIGGIKPLDYRYKTQRNRNYSSNVKEVWVLLFIHDSTSFTAHPHRGFSGAAATLICFAN